MLQENTIHNAISRGEHLHTGGCAALLEEKTDIHHDTTPLRERAWVGAGLPAMYTPRYFSATEVMQSKASQLPHKPCSHRVFG
ncbi:hypothetical protein PflCFBP13514_07190 [Pseudomonas fluorescens]|nr:hypothetical protein PflCFBP13514_07190 [Pseudomonas fluorescens]